ncbi:hypothetical protein ZEAMMB73_Zm00001d024666 [Zea mays]|uniref:Uncharacterized protein n=1 Tax=Zea mays TaxID=4577 RepID=A0A1D6J0W4_MAIZE|nr:hypothetical protein ZEAMMB73_Zm00001d024666 [Zea mays]AQK41703.1 hypothetical protein ZEAMMB73_Zm00001d024666 [Zea mays]AQK41704.1 hypothetical protein ZEAMMB73_Zm00001d024666 [Zea mays]
MAFRKDEHGVVNAVPLLDLATSGLGAEQEYGKYKHIVELSKAIFGLRVNYVQWEPELQKSWDDNQVLEGYLKGTLGESKFFQVYNF